jgi:acyl carrier protein
MNEEQLRGVFRRVFRHEFSGANVTVAEMPTWDSLTHIKLVMELEREFGIAILPAEIPPMYKDYDTVRRLVAQKVGGTAGT